MSDRDYSSFSSPGSDLNHDGRVDFAEYDNDCHDFNSIYGEKRGNKSTPKTESGFFNWLKWQGAGSWIIALLFAISMPAPIGVALFAIIAVVLIIMLITA